jgi:hypothetical protein
VQQVQQVQQAQQAQQVQQARPVWLLCRMAHHVFAGRTLWGCRPMNVHWLQTKSS